MNALVLILIVEFFYYLKYVKREILNYKIRGMVSIERALDNKGNFPSFPIWMTFIFLPYCTS